MRAETEFGGTSAWKPHAKAQKPFDFVGVDDDEYDEEDFMAFAPMIKKVRRQEWMRRRDRRRTESDAARHSEWEEEGWGGTERHKREAGNRERMRNT